MNDRSRLSERIKKSGIDYFMLSFWLIPFIIFVVVPIFIAIFYSFTDFDYLQSAHFVGLNNYLRMLLDDNVFMITLQNTLFYAVVTGPIGYILCFILAWFINDFNPRMRSMLTLLFYAPTLLANMYLIWKFIFSEDVYGLINSTFLKFGIISQPIYWLTDSKYNMIPIIAVIIWMSMGNGFLAFIAGFKNLNPAYYEAANIDGLSNRWQELWYITLPQMSPQLLIGAVLTLSTSFSIGAQVINMEGYPSTNYSADTLLLHIYDVSGLRMELGYASAMAVVLFLIMIGSWYLISKLIALFGGED